MIIPMEAYALLCDACPSVLRDSQSADIRLFRGGEQAVVLAVKQYGWERRGEKLVCSTCVMVDSGRTGRRG